MKSDELVGVYAKYSANNYTPLEVVIARGEGVWVWDVDGRKYLDMLSAYSALNFGHSNPRFVAAAKDQLSKTTLVSRAFLSDQLALFCRDLAQFCKTDLVLPVNSGTEAVESALKVARRWAYEVKGVPENKAEIICFQNNFHGRSISIISFSTEDSARKWYGPYTPGFKIASFQDSIEDLQKLVNENTAAILIEPIQGEGGVLSPPDGFLRSLVTLCKESNVLFLADEVQTGLCRTGRVFGVEHEGVEPDVYILGKSLGGGIVPVSAIVGRREVLGVFTPGSHGSTFGGNPLGARLGREVVSYILEEKPEDWAVDKGAYFVDQLKSLKIPYFKDIRSRGLMVGVDIDKEYGPAKKVCEQLLSLGLLCKDTRKQTIRFTPPLTISKSELDFALERIAALAKG